MIIIIKLPIKKAGQEITLISCDGLANAIENKNKKRINEILEKIKQKTKNKNVDSIVLGCTHYPLIKKEINEFFPNVTLLDSSLGVAKQVKRQLKKYNIENLNGTGEVEFIYSKNN